MAEVRFSRRALSDVRKIDAFLRERNPAAARRVILAIEKSAALLGLFPDLGRVDDLNLGRVLVVPRYRYLIFYRLRDGVVEILYVLHPRQDRPAP